jgi:MFS family permease
MPEESSLPSMFRALRHRNYRLFYFGQMLSLVGTWMQSVAQQWLIYRITGSAVQLGWIGFSSQIPVFLLATFGGLLADRYNRRYLLIGTQAASMVLASTLAYLTLSGRIEIWQLYAIAALLGVVNSIDIPTRQSFVYDMVGRDDMQNAIALNSSMFNGARMVGPAIAGVLVASIGEGWCFFANAVSYIAVLTGLFMMQDVAGPNRVRPASNLAHIAAGYRFIVTTAPVRALLLLLGIMSLVAMPYSVLMPVFAGKILHGGPSALGVLMGASGVGALCGALLLASRKKLKGLGRWIAIATSSFGVFLIAFSMSRHYWLSVALLVPAGMAMMVQMASSNTLIQAMVPDHLRGRVMAVYSMMFMGMAPIGALLAGTAAEHWSAPTVVATGGALAIVLGLVFARRLPMLRVTARQLILGQHAVGGTPAEGASPSQA